MQANINDCKRFAGIVGADDDATIALCMESAVEYMTSSGVPGTLRDSARYTLCTYMLASHYFDHRSEIGEGVNAAAVPSGVVTLIMQLKGKGTGATTDGTA